MELATIQSKIYEIRGFKMMLDFDLAAMYGVETAQLKRAVRRNMERFDGDDFMFELTNDEANALKENIRCQSGILDQSWFRYLPFAFTELGVAMLSSVLRSETAIEINRGIMRAFVMLRQYALGYAELNRKLENFMVETNMQFSEIYQALTELAERKKEEEKSRKVVVGFGKHREI